MKVWDGILSSYQQKGGTGGARATLRPLSTLGEAAFGTPDTVQALIDLHDAVTSEGGDFRVTDFYRPLEAQIAARRKYENWLNAGKPGRLDSNFDPKTMKADVVAKPGYSFHNAGRAIDFHVGALNFPGVAADQQLDKMWELAKPIGWRPIINAPTESASEAWHMDFMGPWLPVYDRLGYKDAAMCACLDIGIEIYGRDSWRFVQAQLHRAGFDVGEVDGRYGSKTESALTEAGLAAPSGNTCSEALMREVGRLPSSSRTLWKA